MVLLLSFKVASDVFRPPASRVAIGISAKESLVDLSKKLVYLIETNLG